MLVVARSCHKNFYQASDDNGDYADLNNNHGNPYPGEGSICKIGCCIYIQGIKK